ncbi:type I secretion C-terminal target domain-containing protein [Planococcaceae bacterium Storch 2/2-2]|nr:type I secretion C-terminal target domain-containing protein [Planococcaceae bacterium Storch 2/2-2]
MALESEDSEPEEPKEPIEPLRQQLQEMIFEAVYVSYSLFEQERAMLEPFIEASRTIYQLSEDPTTLRVSYEQLRHQVDEIKKLHDARIAYERAWQEAMKMNHDPDVQQALEHTKSVDASTPKEELAIYTELLERVTERAERNVQKEEGIKEVEWIIHAILNPNDLTLQDLHRVVKARQAFDALATIDPSVDWEKEVVNYDHLLAAERVQQALLDALSEKERAIQRANDAIKNLPDPIRWADREAIDEAERLVKEAIDEHGATVGGADRDIDRRPLDAAQKEWDRLQREKEQFERDMKEAEDNLRRALNEAKVVGDAPNVQKETATLPQMKQPNGEWKESIAPTDVNALADRIRTAARNEARLQLKEALSDTESVGHLAPFDTLRPEGERLVNDHTTSANRLIEQADALRQAQLAYDAAKREKNFDRLDQLLDQSNDYKEEAPVKEPYDNAQSIDRETITDDALEQLIDDLQRALNEAKEAERQEALKALDQAMKEVVDRNVQEHPFVKDAYDAGKAVDRDHTPVPEIERVTSDLVEALKKEREQQDEKEKLQQSIKEAESMKETSPLDTLLSEGEALLSQDDATVEQLREKKEAIDEAYREAVAKDREEALQKLEEAIERGKGSTNEDVQKLVKDAEKLKENEEATADDLRDKAAALNDATQDEKLQQLIEQGKTSPYKESDDVKQAVEKGEEVAKKDDATKEEKREAIDALEKELAWNDYERSKAKAESDRYKEAPSVQEALDQTKETSKEQSVKEIERATETLDKGKALADLQKEIDRAKKAPYADREEVQRVVGDAEKLPDDATIEKVKEQTETLRDAMAWDDLERARDRAKSNERYEEVSLRKDVTKESTREQMKQATDRILRDLAIIDLRDAEEKSKPYQNEEPFKGLLKEAQSLKDAEGNVLDTAETAEIQRVADKLVEALQEKEWMHDLLTIINDPKTEDKELQKALGEVYVLYEEVEKAPTFNLEQFKSLRNDQKEKEYPDLPTVHHDLKQLLEFLDTEAYERAEAAVERVEKQVKAISEGKGPLLQAIEGREEGEAITAEQVAQLKKWQREEEQLQVLEKEANDLIAELDENDKKENLKGRVQQAHDEATEPTVKQAELTKELNDLLHAQQFVDGVVDEAKKQAFQDRLDAIQSNLVEDAVRLAEETLVQHNVDIARNLLEIWPNPELSKRVAIAQEAVDRIQSTVRAIEQAEEAERALDEKLEQAEDDEAVQRAIDHVIQLANVAENEVLNVERDYQGNSTVQQTVQEVIPPLKGRVDNVRASLNERELRELMKKGETLIATYPALTNGATIPTSEQWIELRLKNNLDVALARGEQALAEGNKNKVEDVHFAIPFVKVAILEFEKGLKSGEQSLHVAAEEALEHAKKVRDDHFKDKQATPKTTLDEAVERVAELVQEMKEGEKGALPEQLQQLKKEIVAEERVEVAEVSKRQYDYNEAERLVSQLPEGAKKKELNDRLQGIKVEPITLTQLKEAVKEGKEHQEEHNNKVAQNLGYGKYTEATFEKLSKTLNDAEKVLETYKKHESELNDSSKRPDRTVEQQVVTGDDVFDLETGQTNPVWVEVQQNGKVIGEGGMTGDDGIAKINLTEVGSYRVIVKKAKGSEEMLEQIHLIMKEGDEYPKSYEWLTDEELQAAPEVIQLATEELQIAMESLILAKPPVFTSNEQTRQTAQLKLTPVVTQITGEEAEQYHKTAGGVLGLNIGILDLGLLSSEQIGKVSTQNRHSVTVERGTTLDATATVAIRGLLGGHAFKIHVYKENDKGDFIQGATYTGSSGGALGMATTARIDLGTLEEGNYEIILDVGGGLSVVQVIPYRLEGLIKRDYRQVATDSKVKGHALQGQGLGAKDEAIVSAVKQRNEMKRVEAGGQATVIQGRYGQLFITQDGAYSYQPAAERRNVGKIETFTYEIKNTHNGKVTEGTIDIRISDIEKTVDWPTDWNENPKIVEAVDQTKTTNVSAPRVAQIVTATAPNERVGAWGKNKITSQKFSVQDMTSTITFDLRKAIAGETTTDVTLYDQNNKEIQKQTGVQLSGHNNPTTVTFKNVPKGTYYVEASPIGQAAVGRLENVEVHSHDWGVYKVKESTSVTGNLKEGNYFGPGKGQLAPTIAIEGYGAAKDEEKKEYVTTTTSKMYQRIQEQETIIAGEHGYLVVAVDGTYTYTPKSDIRSLGQTDTFDYKITHLSGNESKAKLSFTIGANTKGTDGIDVLVSSAAPDKVKGGKGSDTLVYNVLNDEDATGGNGVDHWIDFTYGTVTTHFDADRIDLRELFKGQPITAANVSQYVEVKNGMIKIDRDGASSRFQMTDLLQLPKTWNSEINLEQLIENKQLIIQ